MSSACIKCLVTWIDTIVKLDPTERYKVKFQANPHLPWQRRSFEALRRFAPSLVHIESDSTRQPQAAPTSATMAQGSRPSGAGATVTGLPAAPQEPTARRKL
jgi:hypothetical protein